MKNRDGRRNVRVDQFDCWRHATNILGRLKTSPLTRKCGRGGRRLERRRLGQCTDRRENIGIPLTTLQPPSRAFQPQAPNLDRGTNTTLIQQKNWSHQT